MHYVHMQKSSSTQTILAMLTHFNTHATPKCLRLVCGMVFKTPRSQVQKKISYRMVWYQRSECTRLHDDLLRVLAQFTNLRKWYCTHAFLVLGLRSNTHLVECLRSLAWRPGRSRCRLRGRSLCWILLLGRSWRCSCRTCCCGSRG